MNNNKFVNFASGWVKTKKDGTEYISAVAEGKYIKTKLLLELEDGTTVPVKHFFVNFSKNKTKETHPDLQFTVSLEE